MMRPYEDMTRDEIDANRNQFTKWTADVLEGERRLVLNCQDLGEKVFLGSVSYFCENWPSFDISIALNGLECLMGHRHGLLASSGGIYVFRNGEGRELDYLPDRADISLFVDGSPKGFISSQELKEKYGQMRVELWISDPRLQVVAYAAFLETPERIESVLDPLPSVEGAMLFLRYYDLYKPRLDFSQDYHGQDPYAGLRVVCDDLVQYGADVWAHVKRGVRYGTVLY